MLNFHETKSDGEKAVPSSSERVDEFVRLLGQNQRKVFVFVMSMVPSLNDAEEIIQETNLLLWREFDHFQSGTNFAAWACRVALNQTMAWRKRKRRDRLEFTPEFLEAIAAESTAEADRLEERTRALAHCIEKLPEPHRRLLRTRYGESRGVEVIGQELGRTVAAVYRSLSRIRHTLHDCVTQTLTQGQRT
ncbi:RNA polymerase sigma-70 factor, ECF subfamily [Singulisphaera sp. GP187]|uniref:sigma-70 family RNA polymerase sigma factor n=1 Tax=Singulisphaera sp. GP187 TaxID=1882752 RepID=UPI000925B439|nr:sigma-70 family RNA polymerase sigma factor [Singulisphaera sp. GP187]SIN96357.1 RNA polymerase sigma-70 factor, ECF subfamily [Singulisphaera sp. GP187]